MGKFDPTMIASLTKKIKDAKGGIDILLDAKKMERDTPRTIRLVKPAPNQGTEWMYAVEGIMYWINKTPYISPATFGKPCPITEEVEKAKATNSPHVRALLDDWRSYSKDTSYYMPIVPIAVQIDVETGDLKSFAYDGPERILKAPISMVNDIHKIVSNPKTLAGSGGGGLFHQELGFSVSIEKTGKGTDTRYSASLDPIRVPLDDEHYKPYDIMAWFEKQLKTDDILRTAIRSYLYGEDGDTEDLEEETMEEELPEKESTDNPPKDKKPAPMVDMSAEETLEMSLEDDFGLEDL